MNMPTGIYKRDHDKIYTKSRNKKISDSRRGMKFSDEHCRNISESKTGNKNPNFGRFGKDAPNYGHRWTLSKDARKKISIYHKNLPKEKHSMFGTHRSESTKEKISLSHMGKPSGMKGRKHSVETKKKMSIIRISRPNKIFKNTLIEIKIEDELKRRNIKYIPQHPLCNIAIVDFYVPKYRMVIQCDGCYYHGCVVHYKNQLPWMKDKKNRTKNQDEILVSRGYKVYHLWEHDINKSSEKCIDKIMKKNIRKYTYGI